MYVLDLFGLRRPYNNNFQDLLFIVFVSKLIVFIQINNIGYEFSLLKAACCVLSRFYL